jgi:Zn-dependent protease with chaperone function
MATRGKKIMKILDKIAIVVILIGMVLILTQPTKRPYAFTGSYSATNGPTIVKASGYALQVFNKLKRAAGPESRGTRLYINKSSRAVQVVIFGNGDIVIHQGWLTFFKGTPLALHTVLGHELGHWVLHNKSEAAHRRCQSSKKAHRACERAADLYGKQLMKKAGYNHCAAAAVWLKMLKTFGNAGGDTHPTFKQRYTSLRCY